MLKKSLFTLVIVSFLSAAILGITGLVNPSTVSANALERGPRGGQTDNTLTRGQTSGTSFVSNPLSEEEVDGLIRAIYEENNAQNTYLAVIDQFGAVTPFVQIANSEQNHLNALLRQADKYGVVVPELIPTAAPELNTLEDACALGVAAEIADAALYDELMADVTHTDLIQVYTRLQTASLDSHLPQFEICQ
jgi:hypothetical protein